MLYSAITEKNIPTFQRLLALNYSPNIPAAKEYNPLPKLLNQTSVENDTQPFLALALQYSPLKIWSAPHRHAFYQTWGASWFNTNTSAEESGVRDISALFGVLSRIFHYSH